MAKYAKFIMQDSVKDKSAGGAYVPDSVTMASFATFIGVVAAFGSATQYKRELHEVVKTGTAAPATSAPIEHRGWVELQNIATPSNKVTIPILSLDIANVDPNGTATHKLTSACETAILNAWETMLGVTGEWDCLKSGAFYQQY